MAANGVSPELLDEIGVNAYVYLYPLVTMDLTRRQMTGQAAGAAFGVGPTNTFVHAREFPSADVRVVVRPNFDTLYSSAWLDLREGPVVVRTAADPDGRYYALPTYDMWTDAFAAPGQRTSGTDAGEWVYVPPGWTGEIPEGLARIETPTPIVWIIGRTQTNGPSDYANVHKIQDAFTITPLSYYGNAAAAPAPQVHLEKGTDLKTPPLDQITHMSAADYFTYAMALLEVHPPHHTDTSLLMLMARIGLVPGAKFDDLADDVKASLTTAPARAGQAMHEALPRMAHIVNGWQMNIDTMGVYGNSYVKRAIVTSIGLGANSVEDAIYPLAMVDADGEPFVGEKSYVLHFAADELPPVHAFWSVTMYDAEGFQTANELNRFAIGDRDALTFNADGSLDLYLQHESPGADRESNWLPAPAGPLGITMRLYAPKPAALNGNWNPPVIHRA